MGFLKIPLSRKDYNMKENREQSFIPVLQQTSLSRSITQCQKNYLERPQSVETINKKKKENRTGKKMEGNL